MTRRYLLTPLMTGLALCLALAGCSDDEDTNQSSENQPTENQPVDNQTPNQTDNQNQGEEEPTRCEMTTWNCAEFVDGPSLSMRRHGHQSMVLNSGEVLLFTGAARSGDSPASSATNTWEIFDPETDEVVYSDDLPSPRQGASLLQLPNGTPVAVGGRSGPTQLATADYLDVDALEWNALPHMAAPFSQATLLEDGRIAALSASTPSDGGNARIVGQLFDYQVPSWSSASPITLDYERIWNLKFASTPDSKLLMTFAHYVGQNDEGRHLHHVDAILYDPDAGDYDTLETFEISGLSWEETAPSIQSQIVFLPEAEQFLIHLRPTDEDGQSLELHAFLYDPASGSLDPQYVRDPSPGQVRQVLPGDELIYAGGALVQLYQVANDQWRVFTRLPEGIYYTNMDLLPDCRLFFSGERTLDLGDAELRGVDTGFCMPAE